MQVKLVSITPDAEGLMIYIARVSNPSNQSNENYSHLLRYCIEHKHWSIFESAHMTLEIETSLAIATQILRHRSFTFQQLSARYQNPLAVGLGFEAIQLRHQAEKNRQSSAEPIDKEQERIFQARWNFLRGQIEGLYTDMLRAGVARECARMVLPQCTTTRLYTTGNIRSWIHYLQLRTQPDSQAEHREVAIAAQNIFAEQLPVTAAALGWHTTNG